MKNVIYSSFDCLSYGCQENHSPPPSLAMPRWHQGVNAGFMDTGSVSRVCLDEQQCSAPFQQRNNVHAPAVLPSMAVCCKVFVGVCLRVSGGRGMQDRRRSKKGIFDTQPWLLACACAQPGVLVPSSWVAATPEHLQPAALRAQVADMGQDDRCQPYSGDRERAFSSQGSL